MSALTHPFWLLTGYDALTFASSNHIPGTFRPSQKLPLRSGTSTYALSFVRLHRSRPSPSLRSFPFFFCISFTYTLRVHFASSTGPIIGGGSSGQQSYTLPEYHDTRRSYGDKGGVRNHPGPQTSLSIRTKTGFVSTLTHPFWLLTAYEALRFQVRITSSELFALLKNFLCALVLRLTQFPSSAFTVLALTLLFASFTTLRVHFAYFTGPIIGGGSSAIPYRNPTIHEELTETRGVSEITQDLRQV